MSHAKEFIESWGGSIKVESSENTGTIFTIHLPIRNKAAWYLPRLKINSESKIYVLDDQESALVLWKQKLGDHKLLGQSVFCRTANELLAASNFDSSSIFLIDYDLGSGSNGLQLLQQLPKGSLRCLVTGHFDDRAVRDACIEQGFFLIPKGMIERLSIVG